MLASLSSGEAEIARTRGEYPPVMDKATAEEATAEPSQWRYRIILGPLRSGRTKPGTQLQVISRNNI